MAAGIRIFVTELAAQAIVDQADYYADRQDEALAARWEEAVSKTIGLLLTAPEQGILCDFRPAKLKGLRRTSASGFPQHLVFYRYSHDPQTIRIVHVLHGARDIEAVLNSL
ncbi:MAG: type II toxin-antitoxin system RelE/ParE family toxin [Acidobacteriaceae bacterium]